MLDNSITKPEGIRVFKPGAVLSKTDFDGLSTVVEAYLSDHAKLPEGLIHSHE